MIASLSLFALLLQPPWLHAQTLPGLPAEPAPTTTAAVDPLASDQIAARLAAIQEEIAKSTAVPPSADLGELKRAEDELRTLRATETWLTQQQEIVEDRSDDRAANAPAPDDTNAATPVSIFTLNDLYTLRFATNRDSEALEEQLAAEREALAQAKERLEKAETKRRTARQLVEDAGTPAERESAERDLALRKLKSREALERVHLRTLAIRRTQEEIAAAEPLDAELAARIDEVRAALGTKNDGVAPPYEQLIRTEADLRRDRENAERDLSTAELRLSAVQRRFSRLDEPPAEVVEELEILTAIRDAKQREIAIADERIQHLETHRELLHQWERVLLNETSRDELAEARESIQLTLSQLGEVLLQKQGRISGLRQRIEKLAARSNEAKSDPRISNLREEQRIALSHLLKIQTADTAALVADEELADRVLSDIRSRTGSVDVFEYARRVAGGIGDVWNYELTAVDDEPITVASLMIALILVIAGSMLSRRIAKLVGRISVERFKVELGAAAALETMAFYALLASFTLFALRTVNFPLTAFTVLGGALAIGIGFGSQNVMNNFISGLILMLERPVRAQDVVEVDGLPGTIEQIGARSTQIRSAEGKHIIVPNSFFLESNVVNWTLSDDLIRTVVSVGVIYGSPTRLVEKLIQQAVEEDRAILKNPAPIVIFEQFGDNSLNFDVYFWVRARTPMQIRTVQSRIRFRIDDLFRENSLVIAFPQRDVHLDTTSPLDIRMVRADRDEDDTGTPPG